MRKLESLRRDAVESCVWRGHRMRRFETVRSMSGRIFKTAECRDCGAEVSVCSDPAPNDVNIGGSAVAVTCLGSHAARLAEENATRKVCGEPLVSMCECCKRIGFNTDHKIDGDPYKGKYYKLCVKCCTLKFKQFKRRRKQYYGY